jgi:signal transduction histidine kinase
MSSLAKCKHERRASYYGAFAFSTVILAGYGNFLVEHQYFGSERWVPLVFFLGAVYAALGIMSGAYDKIRRHAPALYYITQSAVLTGIVALSPVRGFMGIIVLPLVSQALFDLGRGWAFCVVGYLFALDIGIWANPYGWSGVIQAAMNYATAFVFTIAFTFMTRQALLARERESQLREKVEAANTQLREYAAQAEELATTRERNRVAREIHDGVGHYLTVIKTQMDAAAGLLPAQPERAREVVMTAAKLSADALDDVRHSVGALRTESKRPPLPEALRALTQEAGLPVAVRIVGAERPLSPAIEHALFRSAQEGLTNIRKHAAATAAELALDFRPAERVTLAVLDNGRGANVAASHGFGLRGIRERIEVLGGRVESGNRADGGFALKIEVPA